MTPSSCQGVVELPGKKKCQEMLTLSAVSASLRDDVLIAGQVHQAVIVAQHGRRGRPQDRDRGFGHGFRFVKTGSDPRRR